MMKLEKMHNLKFAKLEGETGKCNIRGGEIGSG